MGGGGILPLGMFMFIIFGGGGMGGGIPPLGGFMFVIFGGGGMGGGIPILGGSPPIGGPRGIIVGGSILGLLGLFAASSRSLGVPWRSPGESFLKAYPTEICLLQRYCPFMHSIAKSDDSKAEKETKPKPFETFCGGGNGNGELLKFDFLYCL